MKRLYAATVTSTKGLDKTVSINVSLSIEEAESEEEAKGLALSKVMKDFKSRDGWRYQSQLAVLIPQDLINKYAISTTRRRELPHGQNLG